MTLSIENILLVGSVLLFVSIVAGKTSYRFGVPTLLFFLGVGMLAGSEGIGGINFDDPKLAQFIGIVSLNFILFSGGLDTNINSIKPIAKIGISLATLGVFITAVSLGVAIWLITDFTIYESLLLGSIVSSTDAAAVFSILRSKNLALKANLRPTLELESGSNDPMAYVLTIAFLNLVLQPEKNLLSIIPFFIMQMSIGAIGGYLFGKLSYQVINRIKLDFEGLYPVLVISLMFITFSATDFVGGNGFLAIYICALYLGNKPLTHKKTILKMFDGLAWLMQIVLFLTLGLLVFPSHIPPVILPGILISLILIFIARPIAVFLSLIFFKMKLRRRFYISWVGLRGAVPIVFATYPMIAGIDKANMIFNIVFFISVTSVLIQGTTLSYMAKLFHVALPEKVKPMSFLDKLLNDTPKSYHAQVILNHEDYGVGKELLNLNLPGNTVIALIERDNKFITPNGATQLIAGDKIFILAEKQSELEEALSLLQISVSPLKKPVE